jgi:hypothetical protein
MIRREQPPKVQWKSLAVLTNLTMITNIIEFNGGKKEQEGAHTHNPHLQELVKWKLDAGEGNL